MLQTRQPNQKPLTNAERQKQNTERKHRAVYDEYRRLFEEERIRYDDVINRLAERFFYAPSTIERIVGRYS